MNNKTILIRNATIVNEGRSVVGSVLVVGDRIKEILPSEVPLPNVDEVIDASGKWLIPGAIDDQVHFREPGAPHKGTIATESAAAVAGGVTSFLDMPNTQPPCCTIPLLCDKYERAAASAHANYAFYLGASHENIEEIKKVDATLIPGVKVFMGSSTGNMLVEREEVLERIFQESPVLIATHCEDEATIRQNLLEAKSKYGNEIPPEMHPQIRSREACLTSTQKAIALALKHHHRLHILHLSTKEEVELLSKTMKETSIVSGEICVHHLFFTDQDYPKYGNLIKCNPAIKSMADREALRAALRSGVVKVVATDHAPHTLEEKQQPYLQAPSGLPIIQYSLPLMFGMAIESIFTPEEVVSFMCHAPAELFGIVDRGFIREGYYADLVLLDPNTPANSAQPDALYTQCRWSPLSHLHIPISVSHTFVNGHLAYSAEKGVTPERFAQPLKFKSPFSILHSQFS